MLWNASNWNSYSLLLEISLLFQQFMTGVAVIPWRHNYLPSTSYQMLNYLSSSLLYPLKCSIISISYHALDSLFPFIERKQWSRWLKNKVSFIMEIWFKTAGRSSGKTLTCYSEGPGFSPRPKLPSWATSQLDVVRIRQYIGGSLYSVSMLRQVNDLTQG